MDGNSMSNYVILKHPNYSIDSSALPSAHFYMYVPEPHNINHSSLIIILFSPRCKVLAFYALKMPKIYPLDITICIRYSYCLADQITRRFDNFH